jgi:hypothetical protein
LSELNGFSVSAALMTIAAAPRMSPGQRLSPLLSVSTADTARPYRRPLATATWAQVGDHWPVVFALITSDHVEELALIA